MSRLEFRDVNVHLGSGSKKFHAVKNIQSRHPLRIGGRSRR